MNDIKVSDDIKASLKNLNSKYEMQKQLHRKKAFLIMTMIVLGLSVPIMLNIFSKLGLDLRLQAILFAGFLMSMIFCSVSIHKADLQLNQVLQNSNGHQGSATESSLNKKVS